MIVPTDLTFIFKHTEHNGYRCEPALSIKFDLTCGSTLYDESRSGNNMEMIGHATLSSE